MKRFAFCAGLLAAMIAAAPAVALDEVTFGTNWVAEAEHGGHYQALADGTYEKFGLKVTIRQGGPNAANRSLLMAGQIDFYMGSNMLEGMSALEQGVPTIVVAAMFQKEPQALLVHPDAGVESLTDIAKLKTVFLSSDGLVFFQWMKSAFPQAGFSDEQIRTYNFSPAPFIAEKSSAQQGFMTAEPYAVREAAGWEPKSFLIADAGFDAYSTTIEVQRDYVEKNADIVQRFIDASAIGWYNYLYGDNTLGNAAIKADNPEMSDGQIAFSIAQMKKYGIVDSGDSIEGGIGCMTEARQKAFYDRMVKAGVVKPGLDLSKLYTLAFVCKGVGKELRR